MNYLSSTKLTNILLIILVVEIWAIGSGSMSGKSKYHQNNLSNMGAMPSETSAPMMNPHAQDDADTDSAPSATQNEGFNLQNMIFAALRCPTDGTVSLADISCKGKDAEERRKFVSGLSGQNLPPRMLFDKIIEKFGEKALTDEALEIRTNNRR